VLLDERLDVARSQLGDDAPVVASPRKLLVGVLDPDDGDPFPPRLFDKAADVRDDRVALVRPRDDAVLHVDDEERGVRPIRECGHRLPLQRWAAVSLHDNPPADRWPDRTWGRPVDRVAGRTRARPRCSPRLVALASIRT
jgi:hypothetical protein